MRVLDMGCGKALTSIFLAKEFGVQVWANDLWIEPTDNWKRIKEAGVEDRVFPIKAEAHELPYAEDFFDAIISDMYTFHSADWWKNHWGRHEFMNIEHTENIEDSKKIWVTSQFDIDEKLIKADTKDYLTFVMMLATRE